MFSITEKANVGLLFMLVLAQEEQHGKSVSLTEVVQHWPFISPGYLEEIVAALRNARLVQGKRGKGGGYTLARPQSNMTIFDILTALDGPLALVNTATHEKMKMSTFDGWCVSRRLWGKVQQNLEETLRSITLEDLVKEQQTFQTSTARISNFQ